MPVANIAVTPRARTLAAALRDAREASGRSGREVARQLGVSHSAVSHWETGKRIPRVEDVAGLLAAIGVTGKKKGEILDLARNASEPDWLTAGIPGVAQQLAGAMECERTASGITEWSPWAVPGLLQSSDYARAVIGAGNTVARPDVEARVLVRMARRDVLNRSEPKEAVFLIGEPGLRQEIGSRGIMAFQMRHLIEMVKLPKVTVQVVPVGRGWHPGIMGPFVFYRFPMAPAIVHIEHHRTGVFLYDKVDVKAYEDAVASIREAALSPHKSTELINRLITELERT